MLSRNKAKAMAIYGRQCGTLSWGDDQMSSNHIFYVRDYGALGNGGDDRAAIQSCYAACNAAGGGEVHWEGGYTYDIGKNGIATPLIDFSGYTNIVTVFEAGAVARRRAGTYSNDSHMFQIKNGSNLGFVNVVFDGNKDNCVDTDEQRHGLYIGGVTGAVSNIWAENCTFQNMRGDGVFMIGDISENAAYLCKHVRIQWSKFLNNRRSGGAHQRGCSFIEWIDNYFELSATDSDQDLDFEASGPTGSMTDLTIRGNTFNHQTDTMCIALSGVSSSEPMRRVKFTHNTILNGHFASQNVADSEICDNTIIGRNPVAKNPIAVDLRGVTRNLRFERNQVKSVASLPGTEAAVRLLLVGVQPSDVLVCDNTIEVLGNVTEIAGIEAYDCLKGVEIDGNEVSGAGQSRSVGIRYRALNDGVTRYNISIDRNQVRNFAQAIVVHSDNGATKLNTVSICENKLYDDQATPTQTIGIVLDANATNPFENQSLLVAGNVFGRGITTPISMPSVNISPICIGGVGANNGLPLGLSQWLVKCTPEGVVTAPVGSTAARSDGGAGTTLYVKESGNGNSGWRAV
jgi:hypothetical protein